MEVWHWTPNGLSEVLEFHTEILRTRVAEWRTSYKDAVQKQSFRYVAEPSLVEKMVALYLADPNQTFLVPEWPTATINPIGSAAASSNTLTVEDIVVYGVGQKVIVGAGDDWEQHEVASKASTTLTLVGVLSTNYVGTPDAPFFVAPLTECLLPNGIQATKLGRFRSVEMTFLRTDGMDLASDPYAQFNSRPLVNDATLVPEGRDGAGRASVLAESGFGAYQIVEEESYTRRSASVKWLHSTYADRMRLRRFIHFMRGRDGEMYVPSRERDLALNSGFSASAIAIDVVPVAPAAQMVGKVIIVTEDGNSFIREITGATDNSSSSQTLQFSGVSGFVGTEDAIVSLALKCRFDTDSIEFAYRFSPSGLISSLNAPVLEVP